MFYEQINYILVWYMNSFILGLLGLLLFKLLFPDLASHKAYPFARFVGLTFLSFVIWVLLYTTSLSLSFYLVMGVLILTFTLLVRWKHLALDVDHKTLKSILWQELFYLLIFSIAIYYVGNFPEYTRPEDYMNFGFINSIVGGGGLPAKDMWLSGSSINYYYFGHFSYAVLIVLSLVPIAIGYNLALVTLIASVFLMSLGLIYLVTSKIFYGVLGSVYVGISGNLYLWYVLFTQGFLSADNFDKAVHIVENDITHFPSYAFWLGGFHANVYGLQTLLLGLFFSYYFISNLFQRPSRTLLKMNIVFGFLLNLAIVSSTWDVCGLLLIWSITFVFCQKSPEVTIKSLINFLFMFFLNLFVTIFIGLVLASPYLLTNDYSSVSGGLGFSTYNSGFINIVLMFGVFLVPTLIWLLTKLVRRNFATYKDTYASFIVVMLLSAFILMILPDFIYMKDLYYTENPIFQRANTVYKLWFQSWLFLALAFSLVIARISRLRWKTALIVLSLFLSLIYPIYMGATQYAVIQENPHKEWTLDGTHYLENKSFDTYHAIRFMHTLSPNIVFLDPVGNQYSAYDSIISAYSGKQTVLGWFYHESVWRGHTSAIKQREYDVLSAYTSNDPVKVLEILQKYNVDYFVISPEVSERYPNNRDSVLTDFGEIVFQTPTVKIYKVKLTPLPANVG